jgi:dTDP-4-dehydrorhamnose 3,5-epimerase-like enzyme
MAGLGRFAAPCFDAVRGGFTNARSRSNMGVIRGRHQWIRPAAELETDFTTQFRFLDVVPGLRGASPTYSRVEESELTKRRGTVVVPPTGARGFEIRDRPAFRRYRQNGPCGPTTDAGVPSDAAGIVWKTAQPVGLDCDSALPRLDRIKPPFGHDGAANVS